MSQENADKLRRGLEAVNRRDKAAFLAICHPDIENIPPRDWPESEVTEGREAVWDFFVKNNDTWEDTQLEYVELVDPGNDMLAGEIQGEMRGTASGAGVHWSFWQVATFREGEVVHLHWFSDRAEALEAAGLSE
jgi:ketosteroid isomerase-like protein